MYREWKHCYMRAHLSRTRTVPNNLLPLALLLTLAQGCAEFTVRNEASNEVGLQYFLPKPHLLITKNVAVGQTAAPTSPASSSQDKKENAIPETPPSDASAGPNYTMQIVYLPDLVTGTHRIDMKPNLGSVETTLTLANGWQLTNATVKLDSKSSEALTAAGAAAGAVSPIFTPPAGAAGKGLVDVLIAGLETFRGSAEALTREDLPRAKSVEEVLQRLEKLMKEVREDCAPEIWLYEIRRDEFKRCVEFVKILHLKGYELTKEP